MITSILRRLGAAPMMAFLAGFTELLAWLAMIAIAFYAFMHICGVI